MSTNRKICIYVTLYSGELAWYFLGREVIWIAGLEGLSPGCLVLDENTAVSVRKRGQ